MILPVLSVIFILILIVVLSREYSDRELDDVHPRIMNSYDPYISFSKWLWVIPLYMDDPISNYPEWIDNLKKTGKKIGLHGVKHIHKEFEQNLTEEYIDAGIEEFTKAFGYYPTHFKAPSLALTAENKKILLARGINIRGRIDQILHTVYHSPNHRRDNGMLIGE